MARYSDYDRFAWIYNRYWGSFAERVVPTLERLALNDLPAGVHILDLCCGTGQLAQTLTERGYRVTGIDGSEQMLRFARENAPTADFIAADARNFTLDTPCDAVFSTFDSLNHILSPDELAAVFQHVYVALKPGGVFVFDVNTPEGHQARWKGSFDVAEADHAFIARSSYDHDTGIARFDLTLFFLEEIGWQRSDVTLTQRGYSGAEIKPLLESAGFADVTIYDAHDVGIAEQPGGRIFARCRKS